MRPLIDRGMYDRLRALRDGMPRQGVSNLAHVFVPVGPAGDAFGASPALRVLFVGRATRGFDEERVSTYEGAAARAAELVAGADLPDGGSAGRSDFWRFARDVLRAALDGSGGSRGARLSDHLGWSNLAKIGDTKGNATPLSLSIQQGLCREALAAEVAAMEPHAVVAMTGDYGEREVLLPVFGAEGWTQERTGPAEWRWKRADPASPVVARTEHPQGKPGMAEAAAAVGTRIAAAAAHRPART